MGDEAGVPVGYEGRGWSRGGCGWAGWVRLAGMCLGGFWRMRADRTLWGTRPWCLLDIKGVVGRGVGVDVAGRWFRPVPESPDPGMVSHTCPM